MIHNKNLSNETQKKIAELVKFSNAEAATINELETYVLVLRISQTLSWALALDVYKYDKAGTQLPAEYLFKLESDTNHNHYFTYPDKTKTLHSTNYFVYSDDTSTWEKYKLDKELSDISSSIQDARFKQLSESPSTHNADAIKEKLANANSKAPNNVMKNIDQKWLSKNMDKLQQFILNQISTGLDLKKKSTDIYFLTNDMTICKVDKKMLVEHTLQGEPSKTEKRL